MAIGEENSNISYDDLHDAFENMRILKSLVWKMFPLKRKFKNVLEKALEEVYEKCSNIENAKTFLEKKNEVLKKKNEWLTSSLFIFSYRKKYFKMILASQK